MTEAVDIALLKDSITHLYDINIDDNGDFILVNNFDTSLTVSLFANARANESEIPRSELRRGWWGDQFDPDFPNFQLGSKLWLLSQARKTQSTLNSAIDYTRSSLQWLIDENHAENVTVTGEITPTGITLSVVIDRGAGIVETKYYDLWNHSGGTL